MSAADPQSVARYIVRRVTEFHTFNPNPGQIVKLILRSLPPCNECEKILAGFREKDVEDNHARQIKRNIVQEWYEGCYPPPDVGYHCAKRPENFNSL